jgi:hypothetical protein
VLDRARSWLFDIFTHNHAEQLRIAREVQRKKLGVDQQDYPYPGAIQGSGNPTTINYSSNGLLRGALLAAGCLLAGGGGAALLPLLSKPVPSPAATAPTTPEPRSATPKPQEFDIQFRIENGEIKVDPPIPVP